MILVAKVMIHTVNSYNNNNRQTVTLTSAVLEDRFDITIKIRSDCYIKDFSMLEDVILRFYVFI